MAAPIATVAASAATNAITSNGSDTPPPPAVDDSGSGGISAGGAQVVGGILQSGISSGGFWGSAGADPAGWLYRNILRRRAERKATRLDTRNFNETVRQYNEQFALKEWATRKGLSMQEAQMIFDQQMGRENLALTKAQIGSSLKSEALSRRVAEQNLSWAKEDREKVKEMSKAFSRGMTMGLLGGAK